MAVIPSGTSEPWFWAAREAAANDALTRLFLQMAMRREDMAFKERMYERQLEDTINMRELYGDGRRNGNQPTVIPNNPLGPGAQGSPTAQAPPVKLIPGAQPLGPSTDTFTPQKTSARGVDQLIAMYKDMQENAQADPTDAPTDISAQSRVSMGAPQPKRVVTTREKLDQPTTQLPRAPYVSRQPAQQAAFVPIDQKILQAWDKYEQDNKLPRGVLLAQLGLENAGGRNLSRNPNSSAVGLFQWTDALRKDWGLRPDQANDPYIMGEYTARNLRRNADVYTKLTGRQLGTGAEDVLKYSILHQFGVYDGPRILATADLNPDTLLTKIMHPGPGGQKRDNYRTLVNNNIPGNATVRQVFDARSKALAPWQNATIIMQDQPQRTQQAGVQQSGTGSSDPIPFIRERAPSARTEGMSPVFADRLAAVIQEAEEATGAKANIPSSIGLSRTREDQIGAHTRYRRTGQGLAARPGFSRHEMEHRSGQGSHAADIARGPVLTWMHQNRGYIEDKYGLSFLRGRQFLRDPVHIQLSRVDDPKTRMFAARGGTQAAPTEASAASYSTDKPVVQRADVTQDFGGPKPSAQLASNLDVFGGTQPTTQVAGKQAPQQQAGGDVPLPRPRPQQTAQANVPLPRPNPRVDTTTVPFVPPLPQPREGYKTQVAMPQPRPDAANIIKRPPLPQARPMLPGDTREMTMPLPRPQGDAVQTADVPLPPPRPPQLQPSMGAGARGLPPAVDPTQLPDTSTLPPAMPDAPVVPPPDASTLNPPSGEATTPPKYNVPLKDISRAIFDRTIKPAYDWMTQPRPDTPPDIAPEDDALQTLKDAYGNLPNTVYDTLRRLGVGADDPLTDPNNAAVQPPPPPPPPMTAPQPGEDIPLPLPRPMIGKPVKVERLMPTGEPYMPEPSPLVVPARPGAGGGGRTVAPVTIPGVGGTTGVPSTIPPPAGGAPAPGGAGGIVRYIDPATGLPVYSEPSIDVPAVEEQ